ncbi:proheparin-binding EGF-like growth factor-like [Scleropages formosus]|uniref:Proheparin-binding EGF-like growth factor-like n=1 Tax=Scleropages formosus TaxID=113540 RepID=A0A0P7UKL7_SCLFO|nr:proheparin-binding EGF-like growth factor-like [Scleropages formosus]
MLSAKRTDVSVCSATGAFELDFYKADVEHTEVTRPQHTVLTAEYLESDLQNYEDDEYDHEEEEGSYSDSDLPQVQFLSKPGEKGKSRRKGKGKRKHKGTTANGPITSGYTQHPVQQVNLEDPCSTTHQDYCIHGHCKYMEDLREPTCVCNKGYDGERCGIRLLKTEQKDPDADSTGVVQTVLVTVAVVLSLISCSAVLLMLCTQ